MYAYAHRPIVLLLVLACLLAACAQPATPAVMPTEELPTAAPSDTPEPAATATAVPTKTSTPTPVTPTATPTPVPPTKTPRPTATATPGPGDVVYAPRYETDWKKWDYFYFGSEQFEMNTESEILTLNIAGADTYVYAYYVGAFDYTDIQIDVDVTVVSGPNRNNLSIMCRQSDLGWYEFNVFSGGLWTIFKYDENIQDYRELASGGSTAIKMGQQTNHLAATCVGDTLTFYINDVKVGSAKDAAFPDGTVGMSASTFDIGRLNVRFKDFTVRLADPEAELGAAVAPTVPPQTGGSSSDDGSDAWAAYFMAVPVPGGTLANVRLQIDVMSVIAIQASASVPATCQDIRITATSVTQIVRPFQFSDDQTRLMDGEWLENWTLTACGAAQNFQVRYVADGAGGIDFVVKRAS